MSFFLHFDKNFNNYSLRFISALILLPMLYSCGIARPILHTMWKTEINEVKGTHIDSLLDAWGAPNVLSKAPDTYHWMKRADRLLTASPVQNSATCEMQVYTDEHGIITDIWYSGSPVTWEWSNHDYCYGIFPLP